MKKLLLFFVALLSLGLQQGAAAVFSTSPKLLQQNSKNVKIYFNADESGVDALKKATTLYAHIGVTLESAPSTWTHVKGTWTSNTADKQFKKNQQGLWELNIGDIPTYFNITDASEKVVKIAMIARTADGRAQTGDNFINVLEEGYQMSLDYDASSLVLTSAKTINFTVNTTEPSSITLSVDGTSIGSATAATELTKGYAFNTKGKFYKVVATASNGSETLTEEVTVAYPQASSQATYPGGVPRQGAVKNADGTVTFCLAAPNKTSVILVPSWDDYQTLDKNVMKYQDYNGFRYFWITTDTKLSDHEYYPYYYLVDGTRKVADPYARLMLDNYSDKWLPEECFPDKPKYPYDRFDDTMLAVYRGDFDDYSWDDATLNFKVPDRRALNIYEILLRDFTGDGSDQDGKTFGTFRLAMEKIPYLVKLGINAVELMPVMEFNGNSSWGYNTNGYLALDKAYGSPDDMRAFVDACHRHGIAVILDIVFNQSDGLHPWYQMYDIKSNPFYNETAPHSYSVLNDWNQDCKLVTDHWKDVLKFWMESYKVDGFRFDLVKGLGKNSSFSGGTDAYNSTRVALMKELHAAIASVKSDGIHINELLGDSREENDNGSDGQLNWQNINNGAQHYAVGAKPNGWNDFKPMDTQGFMASKWGRRDGETVAYAESHDEKRVARAIKESGHANVKYTSTPKQQAIGRLGSIAAQMLLTPGSKMIWQFGELAADDQQGSDLEKLRAIAPKWDHLNVSQREELHGVYRALCQLRLKNQEMFNGSATCILSGYSNDLNSMRTIRLTSGDKEIIAFINSAVSGQVQDVSTQSTKLTTGNCQLIAASFGNKANVEDVALAGSGTNVKVSLPANSFAVFATKSVSDIESIGADFPGSPVTVYAESGRIVIDGEYENAEVYNMQGMRFASLEVPAGLYVVRVDGVPFKILVK